jgi:ATP-dependent protease ClpP protease subunit
MAKLMLFIFLIFSMSANAAHVVSRGAGVDISTHKTVTIIGEISEAMVANVAVQLDMIKDLPGPIVVVIYSPGGDVDAGARIITMLHKSGNKLVCVAIGASHSMAFNILTHCDVRLATIDNQAVAHKVALGGIPEGIRMTAKEMALMSRDLEARDRQWDGDNARALHLSPAAYDVVADAQHNWSAIELLGAGYLAGIATLD